MMSERRYSSSNRQNNGTDVPSSRHLTAKEKNRRESVIKSHDSPCQKFIKTPYDEQYRDVDYRETTNPGFNAYGRENTQAYSRFRPFTSSDGFSLESNGWNLPTMDGKIVRTTNSALTGQYDVESHLHESELDPRERFLREYERLEKSFEDELMSTRRGRYSARYTTRRRRRNGAWRREDDDFDGKLWSFKHTGVLVDIGSIYPLRKMPQSYLDIKAQCLRSGRLYEDPEFGATDDNVFTSKRPPRPFVWLRPPEIDPNATLIDEGASRMDVAQGRLGDCWFLAAIAALTQEPELFKRVVMPFEQGFDKANYCGAFCFRFWHGGEWIDVVIDDRLPTINKSLIFVHSKSRCEFWSALIEKAYAKISGSYEAMKGGQTSEALEDFTGGVTEPFDLGSKADNNLFQIMHKATKRQSLMGCSINAKPNQVEAKLDNGLVMGHAYTVTGVRKVKARSVDVELVRVRNPWGNEREWTGPWGDKSREWSLLSDREKRDMELTFDDDGEFWMSYSDFVKNFQRLEVCMLSPEGDSGGKVSWESGVNKGRWRTGSTAGGCRNFPDTFHRNPQYRVVLTDVDEDDDNDMCTLIISLMQVGRRKLRSKLGANANLTIGFAIYKLEEEDQKAERLDKDYFLYHASTARSNTFINAREITNRFHLKPGCYCVVPSTFDSNVDGDFLLRTFAESAHENKVQDHQTRVTVPVKPKMTASEDRSMDAKYKQYFNRIAGDDEVIDSHELKMVLDSLFGKDTSDHDFNLETCRSLVCMFDDNATGKLEFDEFKQLLVTLSNVQKMFKKYDKDNSKDMDSYELADALGELGITTSSQCMCALLTRYSNKKGRVDFDDFVQIYVRIVNLIGAFDQHKKYGNEAKFEIDQFIEAATRA